MRGGGVEGSRARRRRRQQGALPAPVLRRRSSPPGACADRASRGRAGLRAPGPSGGGRERAGQRRCFRVRLTTPRPGLPRLPAPSLPARHPSLPVPASAERCGPFPRVSDRPCPSASPRGSLVTRSPGQGAGGGAFPQGPDLTRGVGGKPGDGGSG